MGGSQPFMYDAVPRQGSKYPYHDFDPKAVTRASLTPKAPRVKQEGPLVSFNQHPDSYLIVPYGNTNAKGMRPSIKKWVKGIRITQLLLRCLELLGAIGLLATMVLISNVNASTGWLMRIPAGVAILHTTYSIYHLARHPGGRTPASSASYSLFAAAADATIVPFYAFAIVMSASEYKFSTTDTGKDNLSYQAWSSLLPAGEALVPKLSGTAFLCASTAAGLHTISLLLSLWLAIIFRKITKLPPDMNPLESNLTSRHVSTQHKRNKSSVSTLTLAEKASHSRTSSALESHRRSGAPYEDLARPPTIPFFHTRQGSSESFDTYSTTPPQSRDRNSRLDSPSRQYQIPTSKPGTPRASTVELKRTSYHSPAITSALSRTLVSPTKPARGSYASLPMHDASLEIDNSNRDSGQTGRISNQKEAWYTAESLPASARTPTTNSRYHPLFNSTDVHDINIHATENVHQVEQQDENDDAVSAVSSMSASVYSQPSRVSTVKAMPVQQEKKHPNPLEANPYAPYGFRGEGLQKEKAVGVLSEISLNSNASTIKPTRAVVVESGDLADQGSFAARKEREVGAEEEDEEKEAFKVPTFTKTHVRNGSKVQDLKSKFQEASFKAQSYGELRAGTPPVMLVSAETLNAGDRNSKDGGARQVSSGNDVGGGLRGALKFGKRREVSGKVAEEGRGAGGGGWGARFRKVSGKAGRVGDEL